MTFELRDVSFSYRGNGKKQQTALSGLDLTVRRGECVGIAGAEGSGKSTLLRVLDILLKPDGGSILVDGRNPWDDRTYARELRMRIGLLFQFPEQYFLGETVEAEMWLGHEQESHDATPLTPAGICRELGLRPEMILHRSPFSLSMGEGRRVAIGSLLLKSPSVLLLDEPTAGLDGKGLDLVIDTLERLIARHVTLIVVSHDLDFLADVVSRVIILERGGKAADSALPDILQDNTLLARHGYEAPQAVRFSNYLRSKGIRPASIRPRELKRLATRLL